MQSLEKSHAVARTCSGVRENHLRLCFWSESTHLLEKSVHLPRTWENLHTKAAWIMIVQNFTMKDKDIFFLIWSLSSRSFFFLVILTKLSNNFVYLIKFHTICSCEWNFCFYQEIVHIQSNARSKRKWTLPFYCEHWSD